MVRQVFKNRTGFFPTRADLFIIGFVLLLGVTGFVLSAYFKDQRTPERVVIEVNGKEYAAYDFNFKESVKKVEVETEFGYNSIKLEKGRVRVVEASCKNQLDVKAGWISRSGEQLVCLPNRLVVRLEGGETEVDAVVY